MERTFSAGCIRNVLPGIPSALLRCDCGNQLQAAMRQVEAEGRGIILYMRQEGRGIGPHQQAESL